MATEFYNLIWLLLPVAAVSGWYVGRRITRKTPRLPGHLSSDYFKGLNYLLNEQTDKAIEVFIRMVEVDKDTLETHFALGNLFRRRGEVDRAIRIHQNLIARTTLTSSQREQALLALGEDYMKAGLFDRAEDLYKEILELMSHNTVALRNLIDIYQQEKDWISAIEAMRELGDATKEYNNSDMAHYFCELAEQAIERGDTSAANRYLDRALNRDDKCVRANIIRGRLLSSSQKWTDAINVYKQVPQQDPEYLPEVIEPLLLCYKKEGIPYDIIPWLKSLVDKSAGLSPVLALAGLIRQRDGEREAVSFITEQLRRRPSVRGLGRLIDLHFERSDGAARRNLMILRDLTQQLMAGRPAYLCEKCGFKAKAMHWQCPGCKRWNTVKPIHGVEGE